MKVIAARGLKVPMHNKPGKYIDDASPVEITPSPYYDRQIMDGDLLIVEDAGNTAVEDAGNTVDDAGQKPTDQKTVSGK